jgi:hypothetical protein
MDQKDTMNGSGPTPATVPLRQEGRSEELAEYIPEGVVHLKEAIRWGVPWHLALLEAIGLWTRPHEVYQGRTYQYLLQGEAFDWLLLAERLCAELDGIIPLQEKEQLLFHGKLPVEVEPETFRDLLGFTKYRAFLNYWYGVVVEEALQLEVEEEVRKTHRARCYADNEDLVEEAFVRLYGETRTALLEEFRRQSKIPRRRDLSLTNLKEFTYWLWKRRLHLWDPARVASDTRRGIQRLRQLQERVDCRSGEVTE